jgi:zinc protease
MGRRYQFLSVLVLAVACGVGLAASQTQSAPAAAASAAPLPEIAYDSFVLPNGLTVIVHEDHKAPIVAVNVWYQ